VDFALEHSSHYRLMFGAYGATSAQQNPELAQAATQAFMVLVNGGSAGRSNSSGRLRTISVGSLGIDMGWQCC